jgi:hemoglobin
MKTQLLHDIATEADVKRLVDAFYEKVNADELLSPVFNEIAAVQWAHLPVMYSFWSSILLGTASYYGRPFPKHLALPVRREHFDRWLQLFTGTVDELFEGDKAEEAKMRGYSIAQVFQYRMGLLAEGN